MTDDETDETVMLTRRDRQRSGAGSAAAQPQQPSGADRDADANEDANEATVVVDRSVEPKTDAPEDATVVVSRPGIMRRRKRGVVADLRESESNQTTKARRVESFAAPTGGPTPTIYKPRPAPIPPAAPPVVVGVAAPTRVEDPGLPSVAKQGQRWSLITLAAAVGACVVSAAGLFALGVIVFG